MAFVRLRGSYSTEDSRVLTSKGHSVLLDENVALETVQQDNQRELEAAQNVFVIRPRQTGLSSVAELTAQSIRNPSNTLAVVTRDESASVDAHADHMSFTNMLRDAGAQVFDTVEAASDYLTQGE